MNDIKDTSYQGTMPEYMDHIGGGAWNRDATPSIEQDYGIKDGYHYSASKEDMEKFLEPLNIPVYKKQGIVKDVQYGIMSHKRTVFVGTLKYNDIEYWD